MQIEVRTDNVTEGHAAFTGHIKSVVESEMERFSERITRIEVHLSDVNGHKGGHEETRCVMEARLQGRPAVAVTHQETTPNQAIYGAAGKLKRLVESTLSRESSLAGQRDHH